MSNMQITAQADCDIQAGCDALTLIISPKDKDLGGFSVRRALPNQQIKRIGPWVFFDHMGPADFQAGQGINVRPHPHINIATVTYLFDGAIMHRDSIGSVQIIHPGDINLMVAGSGIVHSEREPAGLGQARHTLHGLQLWLALPAEEEETAPAFYHYRAADIPQKSVDGVNVRVMMGSAYGVTSPVRTFSPTCYLEAHLKPGQTLTLPDYQQRGLYVVHGELELKGTRLPAHTLAVFSEQPGVTITAREESRIALIGGEDIGPRYFDWNFVSSNKERLLQAREQWINREFPLIPEDADEFIPYPSSKPL